MIVNDDSSIVNKLETLLIDDTRVIIYDCNMFIVEATELYYPEETNLDKPQSSHGGSKSAIFRCKTGHFSQKSHILMHFLFQCGNRRSA